jgi:hypothetical protein
VGGLLHAAAQHPALEFGRLREPAGDGTYRLRLLLCHPLTGTEGGVLSPVREPEVEERDETDAHEQPPGVDGPRLSADQPGRDQRRRGRHGGERGVAARARPRRGHGQVVRSVGIVVEALAGDAEGTAEWNLQEQLEVVEPAER